MSNDQISATLSGAEMTLPVNRRCRLAHECPVKNGLESRKRLAAGRFPRPGFVVDIRIDWCFLGEMPVQSTVFPQITALLYQSEFSRCIDLFPMPCSSRPFSAENHFLALCFGQLTCRESLRDVVACLQARPGLQYHPGFRGKITRTNFAYANQKRDGRVFGVVAEGLLSSARQLYQDEPKDSDFPTVASALDSSIIYLSLKLFP
jgi:hypothetical protein